LFLTLNCREENEIVKQLPELPEELSANLELARTAPVLQTGSVTAPVKPEPDTAGVAPVPRTCVTKYWAQVIYPVSICYPPNVLINDLDLKLAKMQAEPADEDSANSTSFYKLSAFKGKSLTFPYFCTVKGGPWIAEVTRVTSCIFGEPAKNMMEIVGIPEPVVFVWYGSLDDYPKEVHLVGPFSQIGEEICNCCPGYVQCPDGSCKPITIGCGDPFPTKADK
jgi:hypothetical protein